MFRPFFLTLICFLLYIPYTSNQDGLEKIDQAPAQTKLPSSTGKIAKIKSLIEILTSEQYRYETTSFALTLHNILPNSAKFFHELGEEKYESTKNVLRLCQVLNLNVQLNRVSAFDAKSALAMLGPKNFNAANFRRFLNESKNQECQTVIKHLDDLYNSENEMSENMGPIQLYLKKKMFKQQKLTCKLASDLFARVDQFFSASSSTSSIPFSFMYLDAHAAVLRSS